MEELLKQIISQLSILDEKIDRIDSKVDNLDKRVSGLEAKVDNLDKRVNGLEAKVDNLDKRVSGLEAKVDRLQQTVDAQHVENISADDKLYEAIQGTNNRLDFQREKISRTEEDLYLLKQKNSLILPNQSSFILKLKMKLLFLLPHIPPSKELDIPLRLVRTL